MKPIGNHALREVLLLFVFTCVMLLNFNQRLDYIHSDGEGYYDYLPSVFIRKDLVRHQTISDTTTIFYPALNDKPYYKAYRNGLVNKYYCGTATILLPLFLPLHLCRSVLGFSDTGYEFPYQVMVLVGALLCLFVGLIAVRKILCQYRVRDFYIVCAQISILFSTPFTNYAWFDASYSHVFSFALISLFLLNIKLFTKHLYIKHLWLAGLALGLITILRPVNFLVCLALPLIIDLQGLFRVIDFIKTNAKPFTIAVFLFLAPIMLQMCLWYLQTGYIYVYSYQHETFDFLNPQLLNILFSYQKGLFVYCPILAILIGTTVFLNPTKNTFFKAYFLFYFTFITYVFSSWWCWFYGSSYGQRVYLEYLPILILPIKLFTQKPKFPQKLAFSIVLLITITVNLIQTWQYQHYILHWDQMNKEKYWRVFLRTSNPYMGWVWKEKKGEATSNSFQPHQTISYYSKGVPSDTILKLAGFKFKALENGAEYRISLNHHFPHEYQGQIALFAIDTLTQEKLFWEQKQLLQFCNGKPGKFQTGDYWFKPKPTKKLNAAICYLVVYHLPPNDSLKDIKIQISPSNP